jgi:hypothetical protein
METKTIDINSFDMFSLEQVQNTFSNSLMQENDSATKSEKSAEDFLFSNRIDCNIPSFLFVNFKESVTNLFYYESDSKMLGYLCRYQLLFEKQNLIYGIGKYKIKQNAYMAVVLFDSADDFLCM